MIGLHDDEYADPGFTCKKCGLQKLCKQCGSNKIIYTAGIGATVVFCGYCDAYL
jgi:hypothetical protein